MKITILRWDHCQYAEAEVIEVDQVHISQGAGHCGHSLEQTYVHIRGRARSVCGSGDSMQIFLAATTPYKIIRPLLTKGGAA